MAKRHLESHIQSACTMLQDKHDARFASTYGEPGYSDPERGIIFANWNNVPKGMADWLESVGYALEWLDEWDEVNDKAYRTSPDSYSWECQLHLTTDGEYLTPDDGADAWIDELACTDKGQPIGALPSWVTADDIEAAGFVLRVDGAQTGFHSGMTDNPDAMAREAFDSGKASRVVFRRTENSQFYTTWQMWVEPASVEEMAED